MFRQDIIKMISAFEKTKRKEMKRNRARIVSDNLEYQISHLQDEYKGHQEKFNEINVAGHA